MVTSDLYVTLCPSMWIVHCNNRYKEEDIAGAPLRISLRAQMNIEEAHVPNR